MSDRRLRELDRIATEEGTREAMVAWAIEAHRGQHLSFMPCLACKGCGSDCSCHHDRDKCESCQGSGFATLDTSTVVGSALGDPLCARLAGWSPKKRVTDTTLTGMITGFDFETGAPATRPLALRDRIKVLTNLNAGGALRRAVAALAEECLARNPSPEGERAMGLLRAWALESCPVAVRNLTGRTKEHLEGLNLPWAMYVPVTTVMRRQIALIGDPLPIYEREVVPWLLGRRDPLVERVEKLAVPQVEESK